MPKESRTNRCYAITTRRRPDTAPTTSTAIQPHSSRCSAEQGRVHQGDGDVRVRGAHSAAPHGPGFLECDSTSQTSRRARRAIRHPASKDHLDKSLELQVGMNSKIHAKP